MDVWRYSDWYGSGANEVRNSQRHIWQWRDWIIESLNQDKGYDRMILEMLAGDEIAPTDPATLRATGFLVRNWFRFNRNLISCSPAARRTSRCHPPLRQAYGGQASGYLRAERRQPDDPPTSRSTQAYLANPNQSMENSNATCELQTHDRG